jgi:hypothetical protein
MLKKLKLLRMGIGNFLPIQSIGGGGGIGSGGMCALLPP